MIKIQKKGKSINLTLKLMYLLLISILVVNCSIAAYKNTYNATTTANAATWTFNINDQNSQTFSINLANTVDASSQYDQNNNVIAPGAKGKFNIKVDCTGSKVAINYQINLENTSNSDMPSEIVFYTYNDDNSKNVLISSQQSQIKTLSGSVSLDEINNLTIKTVTIYWQWQINKNIDESSYQGKDFYINATVIGSQKLD